MEYKSNKPYPEINVEGKNLNYAKLLMEDYSGENSEDTAIHSYLYQSFITDKQYKEILLNISKVEMEHLRLLGEAITALGGLPIYGSYEKDKILRLWSSSVVSYDISLKKILENDILSEETAIKNYKNKILIIKDHCIQKLLERIIEDEEIHLMIFQNLYNQYFQKA
jgi:bacterioferritin